MSKKLAAWLMLLLTCVALRAISMIDEENSRPENQNHDLAKAQPISQIG